MVMKPFQTKYVAKQPDKDGYIAYTAEENQIWHDLITRQLTIVPPRACTAYLEGLKNLQLPHDHIPQCAEISKTLRTYTGWSVSPVKALISHDEFFDLLKNKQFPAASFIRRREEFDYLQEPDIFHEFFGHCPMITDPAYADFMQKYGEIALSANQEDRQSLARLYWFTVEFGLLQTTQGPLCYGGGILSSKEETVYAVESPIPVRKPFDIIEALRTPYRIDIKQPLYFVLDDFQQLYEIFSSDIFALIAQARALGEYAPLFPVEH